MEEGEENEGAQYEGVIIISLVAQSNFEKMKDFELSDIKPFFLAFNRLNARYTRRKRSKFKCSDRELQF